MTDKQFENLKLKIEKQMMKLNKLQAEYRNQTGKDHVMPLYLKTPSHLKQKGFTMFKTTLENGMDDLEIQVTDYDYEPYEPMERHYPGASECVHINMVEIVGISEICLLPKTEEKLEEELLEHIREEQDYAKYGYMLN